MTIRVNGVCTKSKTNIGSDFYEDHARGIFPYEEITIKLNQGLNAEFIPKTPFSNVGKLSFFEGKDCKGGLYTTLTKELEELLARKKIIVRNHSNTYLFFYLIIIALFSLKKVELMIPVVAVFLIYTSRINSPIKMKSYLPKGLFVGVALNLSIVFSLTFALSETPQDKLVMMAKNDEYAESIDYLKEKVQSTHSPIYMNYLAKLLTIVPDEQLRNYPKAIVLSQAALSRSKDSFVYGGMEKSSADILACAYYANGGCGMC